LRRFRILHIGDVHFPDALRSLQDNKDSAFPSGLALLSAPDPLTTVVRKIQRSMAELKPNLLLLSGDLTSRGDIGQYKKCVEYLKESLNLSKIAVKKIHVVPGNHDVDRTTVDPSGKDLLSKFSPFRAAWADSGFPSEVLTVEGVRATYLPVPKAKLAKVATFSLNSSIGCGEKRYLPDQVKDEIQNVLKAYIAKKGGLSAAFDVIGESLDTPLFRHEDVDQICAEIRSMEPRSMPVIVSHHNILPQATPRVAMYTEVLNGGLVRSRLSHLQRPLIYCHGHIHDRPVEVIHEPEYSGSKVVCVSAPQLTEGFNIIDVHFGLQKSTPIGCTVTSYTLNQRNADIRSIEIRIPFYSPNRSVLKEFGSDALPKILAPLNNQELRFRDVSERIATAKVGAVNQDDLPELLLEGEWLGYFKINNRELEPEYWHVQRVSQ
jgi:hypothetical protein